MGDPVTMAMVGAALGGGMSAARGGNPIKGALLGAVGGGIGGAVAAGAGTSAMAAANAGAGLAPAATGLKMGAATGLTAPTSFSGMGLAPASAGLAPGVANLAPPAMTGVGLSPAATSVGLLETLKQVPSALNTFTKENPFTTNVASNLAQQEMNSQPIQSMGLMRGNQIPQQQQQKSSFGVPQISLI